MTGLTQAPERMTKTDYAGASACPMQISTAQPAKVEKDDILMIPHFKRLVVHHGKDEAGREEICLDYGEKEISFDEAQLFGFAEALAQNARFVASEATRWADGYDWTKIRPLLELLIEEGILQHADCESSALNTHDRYCPSPLPPAMSSVSRTWLECEAITRELTGRSLELSYLELVVPIYRVAHPAMDAEGRQVGEANVFPKPLRLDIPTDWRVCQHVGSRYQDKLPMNVTALKTMRKHWPHCMAALLPIREAYLRRFPLVREQGWTVGDLQRLSTLVLAVPAYLLMRAEQPVSTGALHPVLSNLFRITDGVRMTLHYMLFMPVNERTLPPNAPITAEQIYAYAERNNLFLSDFGVCAGPRAMIEEFLKVLVDGERCTDADSLTMYSEVTAALDCIEQSLDYAMLGLQVHAVVNSLWPIMVRCYEQLNRVLQDWPDNGGELLRELRSAINDKVEFFTTQSVFSTEAVRVSREYVLEDMFQQCGHAVGSSTERLSTLLKPNTCPALGAKQKLHQLLHARLSMSVADEPHLIQLTSVLMDYFASEQAIVRAACQLQPRINHLHGRRAPTQAFTAADINLYFRMQEGPRRLPYLVDEEVKLILGLNVKVTEDGIDFMNA